MLQITAPYLYKSLLPVLLSFPSIPVDPEGDAHVVSFNKGGSVGIKLIGGNEVGIYVAGIKPGSPAESSGVAIADRITCVSVTLSPILIISIPTLTWWYIVIKHM